MSLDSDPEINAAFGGSDTSAAAPASSADPEISAAFAAEPPKLDSKTKKPIYDPNRPTIGAGLGNAVIDLGGSVARGVGTVGDVLRNDVRAFQGKPTIEYGSPESYGAALSAPFTHAPTPEESPDVKEQARLALPKLGDLPIVKRALDTPLAHTLTEDVARPIAMIAPAAGVGAGLRLSATGAPEMEAFTPEEIANRSIGGQSMGAAGTAPAISNASPELRQAVVDTARKNGGAVNPDVLNAHIEADQHGIQLTKGQATRDPAQFSNEQNSTHPDIVGRLNAQNGQMVDALDNIRREASPTMVGNDAIENGQTVVDSLKAYDEPIQADIRAKYKKLTDANGGNMPIDTGALVNNVDAALKKNYLTASLPPPAAELLKSLKAGEPLDFEGFEAARTALAEAQRTGGAEARAAGIVRNELEQLPMPPEAAQLKGLADDARAAARARFQALDKDPAYQAAVSDVAGGVKRGEPSPLADRFLDKYALGTAPKANVDTMMSKLDDEAKGAVASHTLNTVRKAAVNPNGNVLPNGYNGALQKLQPKIDSLVSPETKDSLESLGRVITNAKVAPPGAFVNYSKSGVIMNAAKGAAEDALNAKTMGAYGLAKKVLTGGKFAKDALAPGAGLDALKVTP